MCAFGSLIYVKNCVCACSAAKTNSSNELMEAEKNTRKCTEGKGEGDRAVYKNIDLTWNFLSAIRGEADVMCTHFERLRPQYTMKNGDLLMHKINAVLSSLLLKKIDHVEHCFINHQCSNIPSDTVHTQCGCWPICRSVLRVDRCAVKQP